MVLDNRDTFRDTYAFNLFYFLDRGAPHALIINTPPCQWHTPNFELGTICLSLHSILDSRF